MIITRTIKKYIKDSLFKNRAIIIYGPRQSGKTTLSKEILDDYSELGYKTRFIKCDEPSSNASLTNKNSTELLDFLGDFDIVVLDEAQTVLNIGSTLKLIIDANPKIQIIATGSSSFELANKINEPLTGRKYEFQLLPLSVTEILSDEALSFLSEVDNLLIYGSYPSIYLAKSIDKIYDLNELTTSYLFKDILSFQEIKKPQLLTTLLQALALQVGNEVSYTELSKSLRADEATIIRYIDLLEKSFIIFRLQSFSRNLRKELAKTRKIYFYDLGIRNALINNFNPLSIRSDVGALWENFCILERKKKLGNTREIANLYFWRTYDMKEIDLIEEKGGRLYGYEFKYNSSKVKFPKEWLAVYDNSSFDLVNKENFLNFI